MVGLSVWSLIEACEEGLAPFHKLPDGEMRFDPDVLEKWLSRQTAPIAQAEEAEDAEPK